MMKGTKVLHPHVNFDHAEHWIPFLKPQVHGLYLLVRKANRDLPPGRIEQMLLDA